MASEAEYEFFKYVWECEEARSRGLMRRGQRLIAVGTLYVAGLGVGIVRTAPVSQPPELLGGYALGAALIVLALLFAIRALGVAHYDLAPPPVAGGRVGGEELRSERLIALAAATDENFVQNELRNARLRVAVTCLAVGVLVHVALFVALGFSGL
ncbi:MAG: hypothetical protein ACE5FG_00370 [Myxococcota bacterium]